MSYNLSKLKVFSVQLSPRVFSAQLKAALHSISINQLKCRCESIDNQFVIVASPAGNFEGSHGNIIHSGKSVKGRLKVLSESDKVPWILNKYDFGA